MIITALNGLLIAPIAVDILLLFSAKDGNKSGINVILMQVVDASKKNTTKLHRHYTMNGCTKFVN
jgi:hypothetical protein